MGLFKDIDEALSRLDEMNKDKAQSPTKHKVASKTAEEDPKPEKEVEDLYKKGFPEEQEEELDEASVTGNLDGGAGPPKTPYAFSGTKSAKKKKDKELADTTGYELVETTYRKMMKQMYDINESYRDFKKDPNSTPSQKVNRGIAEVNKMLKEIEKIVHNNLRLKMEMGVSSSNFWKSTSSRFGKMSERLVHINNKLKELSQ